MTVSWVEQQLRAVKVWSVLGRCALVYCVWFDRQLTDIRRPPAQAHSFRSQRVQC